MTKEVVSVSPKQKLIDVKHIFEKRNFHHHIPVVEKGKLVGMITLTDFLFAIKNASLDDNEDAYHKLLVKEIMREQPQTISTQSNLKECAEVLAQGLVHALVVSDKGMLLGIISTADLIKFLLKIDAETETSGKNLKG